MLDTMMQIQNATTNELRDTFQSRLTKLKEFQFNANIYSTFLYYMNKNIIILQESRKILRKILAYISYNYTTYVLQVNFGPWIYNRPEKSTKIN